MRPPPRGGPLETYDSDSFCDCRIDSSASSSVEKDLVSPRFFTEGAIFSWLSLAGSLLPSDKNAYEMTRLLLEPIQSLLYHVDLFGQE